MIKRITGFHVLLAMLGLFGVTLAVNALMVSSAIRSFSGEVVPKSYMQGLRYNETLKAHDAQRAAGLRAVISATRDEHGRARIAFAVTHKDGEPVRGLALTGRMTMPATGRGARAFTLEETAPGRYEAVIESLPAAHWDVAIADDGTPPQFEARNRLWIR